LATCALPPPRSHLRAARYGGQAALRRAKSRSHLRAARYGGQVALRRARSRYGGQAHLPPSHCALRWASRAMAPCA